jgi:hypothetical protein
MSRSLKPWAYGTFELLVHAEMHRRENGDFDRRIALIGFDNAIEIAITTYLSLHPIQRGGRQYANSDVMRWADNFHTKIDFLMSEVQQRAVNCLCEKADIVWYHEVRNGQYHGGGATVPGARELDGVRRAALWTFGVLFDVPDVEPVIESEIADRAQIDVPVRTEETDKLIDEVHGVVRIAGQKYYTSDVIYALDPVLYSEMGNDLRATTTGGESTT